MCIFAPQNQQLVLQTYIKEIIYTNFFTRKLKKNHKSPPIATLTITKNSHRNNPIRQLYNQFLSIITSKKSNGSEINISPESSRAKFDLFQIDTSTGSVVQVVDDEITSLLSIIASR